MRKILATLIIVLMCILLLGATPVESNCTIYKVGDNNTTKEIKLSEIDMYVNDSYEWSLEPTTLLYTTNGRTSWILNSEVSDYLSKGWYTSQESVPLPKNITMNVFEKTNIPASELEKMLTKGLSGYGQAFYDLEQEYGINAVFAISVAELESGNGTSSAFKRKNNAFGIGPGKYFNSIEEGICYFGQLMNKPLYSGKSIDKIGSIYCVGGNWSSKIKTLMKSNYTVLDS